MRPLIVIIGFAHFVRQIVEDTILHTNCANLVPTKDFRAGFFQPTQMLYNVLSANQILNFDLIEEIMTSYDTIHIMFLFLWKHSVL